MRYILQRGEGGPGMARVNDDDIGECEAIQICTTKDVFVVQEGPGGGLKVDGNIIPPASKRDITDLKRFNNTLRLFPESAIFWKIGTQEDGLELRLDIEAAVSRLNTMPSAEGMMLRFFLEVFTGEPYGFDMVRAGSILDMTGRATVCKWVREPYWP